MPKTEVAALIDQHVVATLSPLLKAERFAKSGRTWRRKAGVATHVINLQGSSWNLGNSGRFTLNFGLYFPDAKLQHHGHPIQLKPSEADCTVHARIGQLMPAGLDHWWDISPAINLPQLATDVTNALTKYGLPWLEAHSTLEAAEAWAVSHHLPYWACVFALTAGNRLNAEAHFTKALEEVERRPDLFARLVAWGSARGLFAVAG